MQPYPFPLRIRRSSRAQRLRLSVRITGAECVIPAALPEREAWAFIQRHWEWAAARYQEAVARAPGRSFWDQLAQGDELCLPLQGRDVPLQLHGCDSARCRLQVSEDLIRLFLPERQRPHWNQLGERALYGWVRGWLTERAGEAVRRHRVTASLTAGAIRIKRMRTRWGSCGAHNDINLNWLLAFVPPSVLEYVVVHELCHIRHRDHSARFWNLVRAHLPAYAEQRLWLKQHGRGLIHRFSVAGS